MMEVLRTFVVDISVVFGAMVVGLAVCITVARRIAVEQRSKREQQQQAHELAMQAGRSRAIEHQKPVNGDY